LRLYAGPTQLRVGNTPEAVRKRAAAKTTLMEFRPLGKAAQLAEAIGFQITHVWDDLAFGEHNAFVFCLTDDIQPLRLYFNRDLKQSKRQEIEKKCVEQAQLTDVPLEIAGTFTAVQKEGTEELEIAFYERVN
jgi:hypothetical protein